MAINLSSTCFPPAVSRAAYISLDRREIHLAGSSARTSDGANPCALSGSEPMAFKHNPSRLGPQFPLGELLSITRYRFRFFRCLISGMKKRTCRKAILACFRLEATRTISPLGRDKAPLRAEIAIPETSVVLPFPLATVRAAVVFAATPCTKLSCQGRTTNFSPRYRPSVIFRAFRSFVIRLDKALGLTV